MSAKIKTLVKLQNKLTINFSFPCQILQRDTVKLAF